VLVLTLLAFLVEADFLSPFQQAGSNNPISLGDKQTLSVCVNVRFKPSIDGS